MVIIAWVILVGGKKMLEGMGKQRFVDTYGGKIAGWTCLILAAFYYEFNFRQKDKVNIENELMVLGGHYEAVGKTIDSMEVLQEEGKIDITKNVKLVDKIFQKHLAETPEKKWTYADVVRGMIVEEFEKKKHLQISREEAQTLIKWHEKKWLPFDSMDPEIGRLIRFIATSEEGGAA
jgi:hypothetical protein